MVPADFWIPGFAPLQFLILFAVAFLIGLWVQRVLTRMGWRITTFWQVVLVWGVCYALLGFVVSPPLPFHLLATYLGLITVALFVYAGATESGWQECRHTVLGMLAGRTRAHRLARLGLFVMVPVVTFGGLQHLLIQQFEPPLELRSYGSPPRTFTVHGVKYVHGFRGMDWIGREDTNPSPEQHAASVTVHIPEHLVELAGGYTHVQLVGPVKNLDDAMDRVESAFPRLDGQLRKDPWRDGPDLYVNLFVVDQDGFLVGTDSYSVGSRFKCCAASRATSTPLGSDVYILPKGYPFEERGVEPDALRSPAWHKDLDSATSLIRGRS